jgi:hypothetical protein
MMSIRRHAKNNVEKKCSCKLLECFLEDNQFPSLFKRRNVSLHYQKKKGHTPISCELGMEVAV